MLKLFSFLTLTYFCFCSSHKYQIPTLDEKIEVTAIVAPNNSANQFQLSFKVKDNCESIGEEKFNLNTMTDGDVKVSITRNDLIKGTDKCNITCNYTLINVSKCEVAKITGGNLADKSFSFNCENPSNNTPEIEENKKSTNGILENGYSGNEGTTNDERKMI